MQVVGTLVQFLHLLNCDTCTSAKPLLIDSLWVNDYDLKFGDFEWWT